MLELLAIGQQVEYEHPHYCPSPSRFAGPSLSPLARRGAPIRPLPPLGGRGLGGGAFRGTRMHVRSAEKAFHPKSRLPYRGISDIRRSDGSWMDWAYRRIASA